MSLTYQNLSVLDMLKYEGVDEIISTVTRLASIYAGYENAIFRVIPARLNISGVERPVETVLLSLVYSSIGSNSFSRDFKNNFTRKIADASIIIGVDLKYIQEVSLYENSIRNIFQNPL